MDKIKIFLIDDHQIVIDGLLAVLKLEIDFEVVGHSLNGANAYSKITSSNTDVLIMDINMPGIDGLDLLKLFNKKGMPCKVIVLSSHDEIKIIKDSLKLGAKGYLSKSYAGENIASAVRKVYHGEQYFSENIKEKMLISFVTKEADEDNSKTITRRELEILRLIITEHTTKEIGKKLYISVNTVDTHRKNLMRKLDVQNTIGLVKYAIIHELV